MTVRTLPRYDQRNLHQTITPSPVAFVQKTNCRKSVTIDPGRCSCDNTYASINIGRSIGDFRPEETFAECIRNGFALPGYVVNSQETRLADRDTHSFSRTESAVVFNCLIISTLDVSS